MGQEQTEEDVDQPSLSARTRPGQIRVGNAHAQRALLKPFRMPHQNPLGNEEYYEVELQRDYNREWPRVDRTLDGKLIFRPGFLQALDDPSVPFFFVYSGVERFVYSVPELGAQALATGACVAVGAGAFATLASHHPQLAAAALVSWLRNSLSLVRCVALIALAALDKMWLFWVLLAGKMVDGLLERHAPGLRGFMWFWFKVWMAWIVLTTTLTPTLPIWPFTPCLDGAFSYPFPIFHL